MTCCRCLQAPSKEGGTANQEHPARAATLSDKTAGESPVQFLFDEGSRPRASTLRSFRARTDLAVTVEGLL